MIYSKKLTFWRTMMIEKSFYHQTENTNRSEISTYIYDYNSWEFNSLHFHKNYEITYVLSGQVEMTLNGIKTLLSAGDFVLIFPNEFHAYRTPKAS